jgi:hypothetical protein
MLKKLRTYLGRVIRDIGRKIEGNSGLEAAFTKLLLLARRVREQQQCQHGSKVYSLHAQEVECIGKCKAHRPYEFGVKPSHPGAYLSDPHAVSFRTSAGDLLCSATVVFRGLAEPMRGGAQFLDAMP